MNNAASSLSSSYKPSRGDRVGLWIFIAAGLAITIITAVFASIRITELVGPGPTAVEVGFAGLPAEVASGQGTLLIDIAAGTIHVTELPGASLVAGVLAQIVVALVTATIAVCLIMLAVSVIRGKIFSTRNSRLVATAGFTGLLGFAAANLCNLMLANGALHGPPTGGSRTSPSALAPAVFYFGHLPSRS